MTTTASQRPKPVKAPAAKPAAKRSRTTKPAVVETPPAEAADAAPPPGTIKFRGRAMQVKRPSVEQLGMWKVTADQLTRADASSSTMDGNAAANLVARAIKLVGTVLAKDEDRDWLQDEILDGGLKLEEASEILVLAVEAFKAEAGSAAPTAGPRPRARRTR